MTHRIVLSEADARGVFKPIWGPEYKDVRSPNGRGELTVRALTRAVLWLVAPEPIACETCDGTGSVWGRNAGAGDLRFPCSDCGGTGRPTIEIVSGSAEPFPDLTPDKLPNPYGRVRMGPRDCWHWEDCDVLEGRCVYAGCSYKAPATVHGTVTIGKAVLIVSEHTEHGPKPEHICVGNSWEGAPDMILHVTHMHDIARNVTEEFGTQPIVVGQWAHPIDGRGANMRTPKPGER